MVWRAISHQFFVILGRLGDAQEHDFGKEFYLFFLFRDNAGLQIVMIFLAFGNVKDILGIMTQDMYIRTALMI